MQQMKHEEFRNEPFTDFSQEENARAMREALAKVAGELGREYPLVIGGERVETGDILESTNPAKKTEVVGRFHKATKELAASAVERANEAFRSWRNTLPQQRADLLFRVASLLRERKHYFSAWMVHEVAKSWPEADGDTAEAIDFCEFYAHEMLRYAEGQPLVPLEGEENRLTYIPLGVGVVIPPWNFPLAIMAGMTSSSSPRPTRRPSPTSSSSCSKRPGCRRASSTSRWARAPRSAT
jgi:1-pyrroline-5-carboxylate dehydrogenase